MHNKLIYFNFSYFCLKTYVIPFDIHIVCLKQVTDPENNLRECAITNDESPFYMRGSNIILKDNVVDFETKNEYSITVKCVDDYNLEATSQTNLFIDGKPFLSYECYGAETKISKFRFIC